MNLFYLTELLEKSPSFAGLVDKLVNQPMLHVPLHLAEQAYPYVVATAFEVLNRPVIFIAAHPETARRHFEQVKLWVRPERELYLFPEGDLLGRTTISDPVINSERLKILSLLTEKFPSGVVCAGVPLVIASALSLAGKCISRRNLQAGSIEIRRGGSMMQTMLINALQQSGYAYDEIVEIPGTYVKRGGLIDIFPVGREQPVRIEFFGDEVESIREFDAQTQRSLLQVESLVILPAKEQDSSMDMVCMLDYLSDDAVIFMDDEAQIQAELEKVEEAAALAIEEEKKIDDSALHFFTWGEIKNRIAAIPHLIYLSPWDEEEVTPNNGLQLPIHAVPSYAGRLTNFIKDLSHFNKQSSRVMIISQQAERIKEILKENGIERSPLDCLSHLPSAGSLTLVHGLVESGWQLDNELILFTDNELFGRFKYHRPVKTRPVRHRYFLNDISQGDLVVHIEHGIGRFAGTVRKVNAGVEKEYLMLEYAGGDTLYVPVEQVDRVSLYLGGGERAPVLNRLGTQDWSRVRQKVKDSVANIASELIAIYAKREADGGMSFGPDTLWQKELEASFPYVETPDQLEALRSVKQDMEAPRPMDRLVCGDVGYGKTEIAVRAAFKAVMEGKQVAILAPTTILTQQHFNTFSERLQAFPIRVAALSRFCSPGEQTRIVKDLKEGKIDICIGTHRILQKDVQFKDLGLVIIDEEQRFGVMHKEHFKKMRQSVDVLTLSATPIPRTMYMALSGIRDMSTMETPPENRLPTNTFVGEFNKQLVRKAILRELERDGQVFFVHNRIHSIGALAHNLKELVPEAQITIAHGRMDEDELEKVVTDFVDGKSQVLVTTTIIESGLDMPNVNTLIVDCADKLGLTQLYQLRGRVGRGTNTAYAYFLFDSDKNLTDHARERLKAIAQTTELGAGFAIAMKDLEIRGAGNLLGVEQSGNIAAVGFNYYCQLLAEAVDEIKSRMAGREVSKKTEIPSVSVDLKLNAYIDQDYIQNTRSRFNIYQRLAKCNSIEIVKEIEKELIDRFGKIPQETANLLYIVEMKIMAQTAGIESISSDGDLIILSFKDGIPPASYERSHEFGKSVGFGDRQIKIEIDTTAEQWQSLLRNILQTMGNIETSQS